MLIRIARPPVSTRWRFRVEVRKNAYDVVETVICLVLVLGLVGLNSGCRRDGAVFPVGLCDDVSDLIEERDSCKTYG